MTPLFKFDGPTGLRYLDVALSMARQGNADVSEFPDRGDLVTVNGHLLVAAAPGPSLLMIPVVWIGDHLLAILGLPEPAEPARLYQVVAWLVTILPLLVLSFWLVLRISEAHGWSKRGSVLVGALALFGTPLASASTGLRQNIYLVAAALLCLHFIVSSEGRPAERGLLLRLGLTSGVAFLMDTQAVLILVAACVALACGSRIPWRDVPVLGAAFGGFFGLHLAFNLWSTGDALRFATFAFADASTKASPGLWSRLVELSVGTRHGVLVWIPLVLPMALYLCRSLARRDQRAGPRVFVLMLGLGWLLVHGLLERRSDDFALGPRYALTWIVPMVALVPPLRWARVLGVTGIVINGPGCLLSQAAINLPFWGPLEALLRWGPFLQWTTVFVAPGGDVQAGGEFPIASPSASGLGLSCVALVVCVLTSFLLVRRLPAAWTAVRPGSARSSARVSVVKGPQGGV